MPKIVTCIAPVNIAVIKYWGKRDEDLILPLNDSISTTLSTENMHAKTTIVANSKFKENQFRLNGVKQSFDSQRLKNCLREIKKRANPSLEILSWPIHICSENNFPTGAGLASSAAGYACLVTALASLYGIEGDISAVARQGSGSACRSIYGGWVHWLKGSDPTGIDSIARQIAKADHWPEMRILVLVVNDNQKKCGSTEGMRRGMETSLLLKHRAEVIVPERVETMTRAIQSRNFQLFAELTMRDSNQFHATCLDTYPPCIYLSDISHKIIEIVHCYNKYRGTTKLAYTFDAGPNACLYFLKEDFNEILGLINFVFPPAKSIDYFRGLGDGSVEISKVLRDCLGLKQSEEGLKYIIYTKVGDGPKILDGDHLLTENGFTP